MQNGYYTFVEIKDGKLAMSEDVHYLIHPSVSVNVLEEGEVFKENKDNTEKVTEQTLADLETFSLVEKEFDFDKKVSNEDGNKPNVDDDELNVGMLSLGDSHDDEPESEPEPMAIATHKAPVAEEPKEDAATKLARIEAKIAAEEAAAEAENMDDYDEDEPIDPLLNIRSVIKKIKEEEEEE